MNNNLMSEIIEVELGYLQPTQIDVSSETLEFYANTYPLLRPTRPEIWFIEGRFIISDGHNQLFYDYRQGIIKRNLRCLTPENIGVGYEAYEFVLDNLLKKEQRARNQGVLRLTDLRVA